MPSYLMYEIVYYTNLFIDFVLFFFLKKKINNDNQ